MNKISKLSNYTIAEIITVIIILMMAIFEYQNLTEFLNSRDVLYLEAHHKNTNKGIETRMVTFPEQNGDKKKAEIKDLYAQGAVLVDAETNRILYEKKATDRLKMASTTKIMTCIIALEYGQRDDVVTFSKYAASMPDVQLNAKAGSQFYLGDLLYSLMLESHNDTAVAIAEHVGGSVEGFAKLMNEKAKALGCKDTHFVTPNGLDAEEHYTTPYDLAVITSYAIQDKDFISITNAANHVFYELKSNTECAVSNKNRFLYLMDGAIGVKTGFTNGAGYCFVGAIKREERTFISVVLGSGWPPHKEYKWADTTSIMNYALDHYQHTDIFCETKQFEPLFVHCGKELYVPVEIRGKLSVLAKNGEQVKIEYDIPESVEAPIEEGATVGYANYYIGDTLIAAIPIFSTKSVAHTEYIDLIDLVFCGAIGAR